MNALAAWLADFLLLSTALLAGVLLLLWRLEQPARCAALCRATLGALAALAVLCALPGWSLLHLGQAAPVAEPVPSPVEISIAPPPSESVFMPIPTENIAERPPAPAFNPPVEAPLLLEPPRREPIRWDTWAAGIYLAGCVLVLVWQIAGSILARRLLRRATAAPPEALRLLADVTQGTASKPDLLLSDRIQAPAAIGLFQATILLPRRVLEDRSDAIRAVLAHEWAHVRGGDLWTLAAARLLTVLLWISPLYWLLRRQVRRDQESLADAAASDATTRTAYAEQLVAWARVAAERPAPRLASSVGLWENPSQLRRRVAMLLDEKLTVLRSCSRRWRWACGAVLAAGALALSLVSLQPAAVAVAEPVKQQEDSVDAASVAIRKHDNGATVELLAIGNHAVEKQTWWNARGKVLTELPFEAREATNISPRPNRQVVFRIRDLPDDSNVVYETGHATNTGEATLVVDGQEDLKGYHSLVFDKPKQGNGFTLLVGVAAGKWQTVAEGVNCALGFPNNKGVVFSEVLADQKGNASAVVSHNYRGVAARIVAVDKKGEEHLPSRVRSYSAGTQYQTSPVYSGLKPEDVDKFALQVRDYQWREFKNLPSEPGAVAHAATDAEASTETPPEPQFTITLASPPADGDIAEALKPTPEPVIDLQVIDEAHGQQRLLQAKADKNRKPNTINGLCTDEKGTPLAGVSVKVYSRRLNEPGDANRLIVSTESDANGEFRFTDVIDINKEFPEGIPDERFTPRDARLLSIVGYTKGRVRQFSSVVAPSVASRGMSFAWAMPPAATLRGRVTDDQGRPVVGAQVTTAIGAATGSSSLGVNTAVTDANGDYAIDDIAPFDAEAERRRREEAIKRDPQLAKELYTPIMQHLFVAHPDFATKRAAVSSIPGTVDVRLQPGGVIEGRITLPDGETAPLADAVVHLQRELPEPKPGEIPGIHSFQIERTTADTDGRYRFPSLPTGRYNLAAALEGWVTSGLENIEVTAGETATAPDMPLTRGARVRVRLIDDKTGEPIRFDKPTKGYVIPRQKPGRDWLLQVRNSIVEFSTEGTTEIRLPTGSYSFLVNVPKEGSAVLTSEAQQGLNKYQAQEGELLEIDFRMQEVKPQGSTTVTFAAESPSDPSEEDEAEDAEPANTFIPATPPADDDQRADTPGQ